MAKSRSGITQFDLDTRMAELMNINPLIDAGGDTYKVQSVIRTLRALIDKAGGEGEGSLSLSYDENFGVCTILDACASALEAMEPVQSK